jgi:predicted methyltransferase
VSTGLARTLEFVAAKRAIRGPYDWLLRTLAEGWHTAADLVATTGLPLREIHRVSDLLADDAERDGERLRLRDEAAEAVRRLPTVARSEPASAVWDDIGWTPDATSQERLAALLAASPPPKPSLDHVPATPATLVRRAQFLSRAFALDGCNVLFLGDNDRTSLALSLVADAGELAVLDIDDDILDHIEAAGDDTGKATTCAYADLRIALPPRFHEWADLVVTDPPYTPEGMRVFLSRAAEAIRGHETSRVVVAYGFGHGDTLGLKVQREIQRLGFVFEAIIPAFNRYRGALAIGSTSSLYILRPPSRSRQRSVNFNTTRIYTHGVQSIESALPPVDRSTREALESAVANAELGVALPWEDAAYDIVGLEEVLGPGARRVEPSGGVIADARGAPSSTVLRLLLSVEAPEVAILHSPQMTALKSRAEQDRLASSISAKYTLTFRPAIVHARLTAAETPADVARQTLLLHGQLKLRNAWVESIVEARRAAGGGALGRRDLKHAFEAAYPPRLGDLRVIDLSRRSLERVLRDVSSGPFSVGSRETT